MAKLLFEYAIHQDDDGTLQSYWPEMWTLETLARECISTGTPIFSASYMNNPAALEGNKLQVSWLHTYTSSELDAARLEAGVKRGMRYAGVDPSVGGQGSDPDFMGLFMIEVIGNRGFGLDVMQTRKPVDQQPQFIEDWLDLWTPDLVELEDMAAQGYVGTAMRTQINNGQGTKYPIVIQTPQGARDKGGKERRFFAMGARFEAGQVKIPGIMSADGSIKIDPHWDMFVNQWRSFPAGHDDMLDGAYWAVYDAFNNVTPGAITIGPEGYTTQELRERIEKGQEIIFATDAHGRRLDPIGKQRPRRSVSMGRHDTGIDPYTIQRQ